MLVDHEIDDLISKGIILGAEKENIQPSSLDIRLGQYILLDDVEGFKEYDLLNYNKNKPFIIKPNGFLLGCTIEHLVLPENISCELKLKSSRAREGLSHSLAGHIECGFAGSITLELKNYSNFNFVKIWYGLRIGQLIFHKHNVPTKTYSGRYSMSNRPVESLNVYDM
jgi:dCTP deaminase